MAKKNLPAPLENEDRYCSHIHEPGHLKEGQRCEAFRMPDSHLCYIHGGGHEKMVAARQRQAARQRELQEDLEYGYHELQSLEGIAKFLEKVSNGILSGTIKRDKAGLLAMFIPQMYKIARDRQMTTKPAAALQINIGNLDAKKVTAAFSGEQLDQFLLASETVAVQVLDQLQKDGKLKVEKRKDAPEIIDIEAKVIATPEELKIPAKELAKISDQTDIPLTKAQVEDLFGDCLGDTDKAQAQGAPVDVTGFGELFEAKPQPHEFTKRIEVLDGNMGVTIYTCKVCSLKTKHPKTSGYCDKAGPDDRLQDGNEAILGVPEALFD